MDIRKIKTLIEMLESSNLNEIEVSQGEESVRISKGNTSQKDLTHGSINTSEAIDLRKDTFKQEIKKTIDGNEIKAPIVGTFYRKPSPDKEPFVKIGDNIKKGDVICIIEAMKMMNEIKSDFEGKVAAIEINDGQPVEYGQTIFIIQ